MLNMANSKAAQQCQATHVSYTQWIHCNQCYEQYVHKTRYFYLLACDHVLCVGCIRNITESTVNGPQVFKCCLCGQQTRACKLGNDMPPHLKELFHPEPYLDGLNTYRIMIFQDKHRKRFLEFLYRQNSTVQDKKRERFRIKEQARKNYIEFQESKNERKQAEKRVIAVKHHRKELGERKKESTASSTCTSHSSESRSIPTPAAANLTSLGITSFSHHSQKTSFIL